MSGNNLEHLVFIAWTCTISLADVPHSEEVNRGDGGHKTMHTILQAHVYLIHKDHTPL